MSASRRTEARLLSHDEQQLVRTTHHPAIYEHGLDALHELRRRLRALRDRERTLLHHKMREIRGKAEPRGGSFPGLADHPGRRRQLFAQALKRVNAEASRLARMTARAVIGDGARRALALRKTGEQWLRPAPSPSPAPAPDPRPRPNRRGKSHIPGRQVGSVSQANRRAQAARDARPAPPA
ncbi:hypothetical protein [Sphingomonas quercus]|uniref:Uncharacterized protein n=1 Tax=Sphingomonas quercus TaxID=2842451 RepID=A0ABS6BG29_9SPHN|nr:hypothetical protein [Sphingomonas quercus]MBU3077253.1 hypothetical protein [Sphingomonas quercus]